MANVFETIARENFKNSGYITHPSRERSVSWKFSSPPRSPFFTSNAVRNALQRRERALHRQTEKPSRLKRLTNALFRR
ncbi:MAG: hypothetical protein AAGH40_01015 [Verrucomicrobiota bacterium]